MKEKVLSVFIDESGDFGQYNPASPNYYGPIHALRYGCMPTLVLCRQSKILGLVVRILDEYMKPRLDRNTPRLMSRCIFNDTTMKENTGNDIVRRLKIAFSDKS